MRYPSKGIKHHRPMLTKITSSFAGGMIWFIHCSCDWSAGAFTNYQSAYAEFQAHIRFVKQRKEISNGS